MKKLLIILFILCSINAFPQVYYEIVDSRDAVAEKENIKFHKLKSIKKQKHWPDSLKKNYNSYDDYSVIKKYNTEGNQTEFYSVYNLFNGSKIIYNYENALLKYKKDNYENDYGSWITESTYIHNKLGKLTVKQKVFTDVYAKKESLEQSIYSYDDSGRPEKVIVYDPDSTSGNPFKETTFTYDTSGNLIREIHADSSGVINEKYEWAYDEKGRLLNRKHFKNSMDKFYKEYGYVYGNKNDTIAYYWNEYNQPTDTVFYFYNESKQLVEKHYSSPTGHDYTAFIYDFTGKLSEKNEYINYRKKTTSYQYDGNNLQTLILSFDENNRYLWGEEISYEFY